MTNFASILDESPEEVKLPPPIPVGTYIGIVQGLPNYVTAKTGNEGTEFTIRLIAAEDDVDQDALEEAGGLEGKTVKVTFWHTEDSIYRLDQFHKDCGIDLKISASRRARNEECTGHEVGLVISHQPSREKNDTRIHHRVARTFPVD